MGCAYKWSGLNAENRRENWKILCAVSRIVVFAVMRQDRGIEAVIVGYNKYTDNCAGLCKQ